MRHTELIRGRSGDVHIEGIPDMSTRDRLHVAGDAGCNLIAMVLSIAVLVAVSVQAMAAETTLARWGELSARGGDAEGLSHSMMTQLQQSQASTITRAGGDTPRGDDVAADLVLRSYRGDLAERIESAGGVVRALSREYLRATVLLSDLDEANRVAALPEVRWIAPAAVPHTRKGAVTSRAVRALNVTPLAGAPNNLSGAGQNVGILSDSFARTPEVADGDTTTDGSSISASGNSSPVTLRNSTPQDSGDLPARVELRRDDATGGLIDEGAAMAELIHDLAPGAALSFHTAVRAGLIGFADGIDDLCTTSNRGGAGATVLVDDIGFDRELMYQPDVLTQAVADCVARGVPYFSAAGNTGDLGFRQEYVDIDDLDDADGPPGMSPSGDFHDWDPATGDKTLAINVSGGSTIRLVLQWNQPSLSVPENATNGPQIDLDLYLFNGPNPDTAGVLASSVDDQLAGDPANGLDPVEVLTYTPATNSTVFLGIDHWAGNQDGIPQDPGTDLEFRLVFFEFSGGPGDLEYPPDGPTIYGHPAADGAVSVAAVPWWEAPFYDPEGVGPTLEIDPEPFSARGGDIPYFFRVDGTFASSTTFEPDVAAVDANNTTFFGVSSTNPMVPNVDSEPDGFPNFFGTSAAAPNAAGVAALLLEDDCKQSPAELVAKLQDAAVDVTGDRAAPGDDDVTGSGLIDAGNIPLEGGTAQCKSGDGGGGGGSTGWLTLIGLVALLARRRKL